MWATGLESGSEMRANSPAWLYIGIYIVTWPCYEKLHGAEEARRAHNPEIARSKRAAATDLNLFFDFLTIVLSGIGLQVLKVRLSVVYTRDHVTLSTLDRAVRSVTFCTKMMSCTTYCRHWK